MIAIRDGTKIRKLFTHVIRIHPLLSDFCPRYYCPVPPLHRQICPKTPEGLLDVHAADSGRCMAKELALQGSEEMFFLGK